MGFKRDIFIIITSNPLFPLYSPKPMCSNPHSSFLLSFFPFLTFTPRPSLSPPFIFSSPFAFLLLTDTHTHERETETEERAWERERERERENCAVKKKKKRWVSGKLRPVGINGSDQQSFVVRSSWNFAERFTTRESPLWTVEIRFEVFCSHFLSREQ